MRQLRLLTLALVASSAIALALSASVEARPVSSGCPMSRVHYTSDPGVEPDLAKVPWISSAPNGDFKALLTYYSGTPWAKKRLAGARIFSNLRPHRRQANPFVLWITRTPGSGPTLKIQGRRLDARGSFSTMAKPYGKSEYASLLIVPPSSLTVPASGCWRLTLTSGRVTGRLVFLAID